MTPEEDYFLAIAYVNVSAKILFSYGNNQTSDNDFWHKVCNKYNDLTDEILGLKQEYIV
jgi:hypothetical protein